MIYLAGPITGIPEHNKPEFDRVAMKLRYLGYKVVSPVEMDGNDFSKPWEWYMRRDLKILIDCDAVFFLQGWNLSKGAKIENYLAKALNIPRFCAHTLIMFKD